MSIFKTLYESKTDVDRYNALMKKTDGQWNVWDGKEKAEYIKKWSWDSIQMKLVKKKAGDKEMIIPTQPKDKKKETKSKTEAPPNKEQKTDEDIAKEEAKAAEEQRKAEIDSRKQKINKTRTVVKDLEKVANQMNNKGEEPNNVKQSELDIKVLAAIRKIQIDKEE